MHSIQIIIWLIGLLSVFQFKSSNPIEILDITKYFYSNQSVYIKFAFQATINQSLLTSSFKSEFKILNEANYLTILSIVTYFDNVTKPDCYPIFMGYAYSNIMDNGDVVIKPPFMSYSFKEQKPQFHVIIPFTEEGYKFYLKYFQNKICTRSKSSLDIFGLLTYDPVNGLCSNKRKQLKFVLEDKLNGKNRIMCVDRYPDIDQKYLLESFGAIFLNYTDEPDEYSTSVPTIRHNDEILTTNNILSITIAFLLFILIVLIAIIIFVLFKSRWLKARRKQRDGANADENGQLLEERPNQQPDQSGIAGTNGALLQENQNQLDGVTVIPNYIYQKVNALNQSFDELKSRFEDNQQDSSMDPQYLQQSLSDVESRLQSLNSEISSDNQNCSSSFISMNEMIPLTKPDGEFHPEGKFISDFKTLGSIIKLSPENGGHFQPAVTDIIEMEWRHIRSGDNAEIKSRPYFIDCEEFQIKMILIFILTQCDMEQFIIKVNLLSNNFINKELKFPLTLKFGIGIVHSTALEFECTRLDLASNNRFINFSQCEGDHFPEIQIKFLSVSTQLSNTNSNGTSKILFTSTV